MLLLLLLLPRLYYLATKECVLMCRVARAAIYSALFLTLSSTYFLPLSCISSAAGSAPRACLRFVYKFRNLLRACRHRVGFSCIVLCKYTRITESLYAWK